MKFRHLITLVIFTSFNSLASLNPQCPEPNFPRGDCTDYDELYHPYSDTMTPACANHDICYMTVGADKDMCDSQFKDDMQSQCARVWGKGLTPGQYYQCKSTAQLMYLAVIDDDLIDRGTAAYNEEQEDWVVTANNNVNNPNCVVIPEVGGAYDSRFVSDAKAAIETATGKHASTNKVVEILQQYTGGESELDSWRQQISSSSHVRNLVNGLKTAELKLSITKNTNNTVFSTNGSTGDSTKIYINGRVYTGNYTDQYSFNEVYYGSTHIYQGYAVTFKDGDPIDYAPISYTRKFIKNCNVVPCEGVEIP